MKINRLITLSIILPTLLGCKSTNIKIELEAGSLLQEIYEPHVENLLDSKSSFSLLILNESCSQCAKAKSVLQEDAKQKDITYFCYYIDAFYINLVEKYPSIFSHQLISPHLFDFKDGNVSFEYDYDKLSSISYSSLSNIHHSSGKIKLIKYSQLEEIKDPLLCIYNKLDLKQCQLYKEIIYSNCININNNKFVYCLFDTNENINNFFLKYQIQELYNPNNFYLIQIKNDKCIDFTNNNINNKMVNMITSYYQEL